MPNTFSFHEPIKDLIPADKGWTRFARLQSKAHGSLEYAHRGYQLMMRIIP